MSKIAKQVFEWIGAALLAALVINIILFAYYRPSGRLMRSTGATESIWDPGTYMVTGTEGYAFYRADANGYLNADLPLADSYILVSGASFTQGKEVPMGKRYTDIVNAALSEDSNSLKVYNVSQEGQYLPQLINGFSALVQEFPNAETIVLEIGATKFDVTEIEQAMNQRSFDEKETGPNLLSTYSSVQKLEVTVKELLPLASLSRYQISLMKELTADAADGTSDSAYADAMNRALALLRSEYSGKIIFLYHPNVTINEDGTMSTIPETTTPAFSSCCEQNGITFINAGDAFLAAYKEDYSVPYGYSNTTPGTGHLSEAGQRILAEVLLKEVGK